MKIDLFKLNNFNKLEIDSDITFTEDIYKNTDIRAINHAHVKGIMTINYEDELDVDLEITGEFILPCAITLDDVEYSFSCKIEENWGKFEDFYDNKKNSLDILPILWENVVSEVPIRVVKEGVDTTHLSGEGWELISDD